MDPDSQRLRGVGQNWRCETQRVAPRLFNFSLLSPADVTMLAEVLCLAVLIICGRAQAVASLVGTWSSGSGAVLTGSVRRHISSAKLFGSNAGYQGLGNPPKDEFNYPSIAGWSVSFTSDGYFEEAQYSWNGNASDPHCVNAVMTWQHGQFALNSNGSISLDPTVFAGDGRVSVAYACQGTTSVLTYLDQPILYQGYSVGPWRGQTMLQV